MGSAWWQPVASVAAVAGVAAVSILWMRSQVATEQSTIVAQAAVPAVANPNTRMDATRTAANQINTGPSYTVPKSPGRRLVVPSTELANYVVAHSEFSSPVTRRNLLSAFMASESGTAGTSAGSEEPTEDVHDDAKNPQ